MKRILLTILLALSLSAPAATTNILMIAGQSNASGPGFFNQSYTGSAILLANDGTVIGLVDPTDSNVGQIYAVSADSNPKGSCWPNMFTALDALVPGRTFGMANCALSGTSIGQWQRNESNHGDTTTLYGSLVARTLAAKALYTVDGMDWWQGEQDSTNGQTQLAYQTKLTELSDKFFEDTGVEMTICKLQNCTGVDAGGLAAVQAAQVAAAGTHHIRTAYADLSGITTDDGFHLENNTSLVTAGTLWAGANFTNYYSATVINSNANVTLPTSANYRLWVGNAPADNSVQTLNPPIFKWIYHYDPLGMGFPESRIMTFEFQLVTNASANFASPLVDVITSNNFYNCFSPLTNANGTTYLGSVYWRIIYMTNGVAVATGETHNFRMASTSDQWDRSQYGNRTFMAALGAMHPHMYFAATNRADMATFLHTNVSMGFSWFAITNEAANTIAQSYWNNDSSTNIDPVTLIGLLDNVALAYQIDSNAFWKAANPGQMLSRLATSFVVHNYDLIDQNVISEAGKGIPIAYDWLYDDMTSLQRSNVLWTMESFSKFFMYYDWWNTTTFVDRTWPNTDINNPFFGAAKTGSSHSRVDSADGLFMAWAGMGESPLLLDHVSYYFNYSIAQVDPFACDEGRGYAEQSFREFHMFSAQLLLCCFDQRMTNNPWYRKYPNMLAYWEPLNYVDLQGQFGDFGMQLINGLPATQIYHPKYYELALMNQNGALLRQQQRNDTIRSGGPDFGPVEGDAFITYYFRTEPVATNWPNTYYFDVEDGWCMSYTYPPNDWNCFTNGVGFVLSARPSGNRNEHGTWHDGGIQIFAYGAEVTCGGIGQYNKHALFYPGVFVDGIGNCTPSGSNPTSPWYSRLSSFTNSDDFTFVQADLSRALNYLNTNGYAGSGNGNLESAYNQATNKRPDIVSVTRNVLFPYKEYMVIYDAFSTTNTRQFQFKWNLMEPIASFNANGSMFDYYSTNFYLGATAGSTNAITANVTNMFSAPSQPMVLSGRYTAVVTNSVNTNNVTVTTTLSTPFTITFYMVTPFYWTNGDTSIHTNYTVNVSYEALADTLDTNVIVVGQSANLKTNSVSRSLAVHTYVRHIVNSNLTAMWVLSGTNYAATNPITHEDFNDQITDPAEPKWNTTVWSFNKTAATNWHQMTVIFPKKWGHAVPTIDRIDDNTVRVNDNEGHDDVITFDPTYSGQANFVVNLAAVGGTNDSGGGGDVESPGPFVIHNLHVTGALHIGQ